MVRPPNTGKPPLYWLALVLLISPHGASLLAQSPTEPGSLEVLSAQYLPESKTIEFKLRNNGQEAVTAYNIAISVRSENKEISTGSGFGEDMLNVMLSSQCRNGAEHLTESVQPGSDSSWEGAIKPGDTYVHSIPGNIDANAANGASPEVHVAVTGVIWSGGKVEGEQVPGWAPVKQVRNQREQDASEETKVVAVLNAHPDDADIGHRVGEAVKSLQALMASYPSGQQSQQGAPGAVHHRYGSAVVSAVLANLQNFASLPPAELKRVFEGYVDFIGCEHQRRTAILERMSPPKSGE
jgi:hypothetical protein